MEILKEKIIEGEDQAFFLPLETRPKRYPPLQEMVGKFWHTGIIHAGKVYECFNFGRNSISNFDEVKKKELEDMNAVFVDVDINKDKLVSEITSGTSCADYVARVVGISDNTGPEKQYWPEGVYNHIIKK